jgi:hypothetical protein
MEPDNVREDKNKKVIKWQFRILITVFILAIPLTLISLKIYHTMRYGVIVPTILSLLIGISSIKDRISILKPRWQKEYPIGKQAIIIGVFFLISEIIWIIFILSPNLSDRFLNFDF